MNGGNSMKKKDEKGCSNCRYQQTGWDGGFFGEPMTCECKIFGETENRKNCQKFKRPFPTGFELLMAFREWYNNQRYTAVCMDQRFEIDEDDLERFRREWK